MLMCVAEYVAACSCAWLSAWMHALMRGYVNDREIKG